MARLFHENFDKEELIDFLNTFLSNCDVKDYIYEETMNILKEKYNIADKDINI